MPAKKFKVVEVKLRREASVSKYLQRGAHANDLKELLRGVGAIGNWGVEASGDRVTAAQPMVDGHPGHVDGSDWKMYIERGRGTVDRLFIKQRRYTTEPSRRDPDTIHVKIYAALFVATDTH